MNFDELTQAVQDFNGAYSYSNPMVYLMDFAFNQRVNNEAVDILRDVAKNEPATRMEIRDKYAQISGKKEVQNINGSGRNGMVKQLSVPKLGQPLTTGKFRFNPNRPLYRPTQQPRLTYK